MGYPSVHIPLVQKWKRDVTTPSWLQHLFGPVSAQNVNSWLLGSGDIHRHSYCKGLREKWKRDISTPLHTRHVQRSINFCASTVDLSRAKVDDSRLIFRTKKYGEKALFLIKTSDVVYILFDSLESDKLLKHTWTKYHIFSANWFSSVWNYCIWQNTL